SDTYLHDTSLSSEDRKKINSIKWLTFEESQRAEAIIQANALIRYFILFGKTIAAYKVFAVLPSDSLSVVLKFKQTPTIKSAVKEYLCCKEYMHALTNYKNCTAHQSRIPKPTAPLLKAFVVPSDKIQYEKDLMKYNELKVQWENEN